MSGESEPTRAPVVFSTDAEGVGWLTFDDPAARANVFNLPTLTALEAALSTAEQAKPRALVIVSAKERIFIAGADLKWLAALDTAAAEGLSRRGQQLFQRLTDFPAPVVVAIHGACAGGGYELALACHWRLASDAPVTQLGLPETSIGTIPGWGGSVRLPRLIGAQAALEHILKGQLVSARDALAAGLVNEVVPAADLRARAKAIALKLANEGVPAAPPRAAHPPELFVDLRRRVCSKNRGQPPALLAAIDAVEKTIDVPLADALPIEARVFGDVTAGDACKHLIHVFFLRDAAKKRSLDGWFSSSTPVSSSTGPAAPAVAPAPSAPIKTVGVIGAGVMGSGIAQWLAAKGFSVVLRDVEAGVLERGMTVVRGLFDDAVKRGKFTAGEANSALQRIAITTDWEGFAACDLVIEAIVENVVAKQALYRELAQIVRPDTILASNTSALPIEEIAGHVANPARTLGIHFFNPVGRMPLVELILAPATSPAAAERALTLIKALGKTPIVCRSSPGFLVTRVLFFYLNAAVELWEEGVPTEALDAALCDFGWPMGPLRLIDEVGVDVTDFIFGEMAHYFSGRFRPSTACARLLAAGLRGRKNGASRGFYRYAAKGAEEVNDAETRAFTPTVRTAPPITVLAPDTLRARLMGVMSAEAERCLAEGVVRSADDVDFALLTGAGFPAWRGGLLRWARAQSGVST